MMIVMMRDKGVSLWVSLSLLFILPFDIIHSSSWAFHLSPQEEARSLQFQSVSEETSRAEKGTGK